VYLDARTGAPLHGDLDASSAATDPTPWSLMPDPSTGRVFVACMGTQSVQAFSSDEPRAASEPIRTGAAQRAMVLRDREHMICISSFDDSTVTYLDTRDVTYRFGDETASTAKTGTGPRGMYFVEPPA
jgi:DNA-binding beta-propeller fold protein YncE